MRIYTDVEAPPPPPVTAKKMTACVCDLCGQEAKDRHGRAHTYDDHSFGKYAEVRVSLEEGSSWPEGGYSDTKFFDICPQCFRDVLVPFIQSRGRFAQTKKVEW